MMTGRLVDADKLMKRMCKQCNFESGDEPCEPEECFIYNTIKYDAPTVDAVPVVHGRWITDEKGVTYCGRCRIIDDYASVHNYCPNCGAKMDQEVE